MARILALFGLLAAFAGLLPWAAPLAKGGARLIQARDNPALLSDLALQSFSAADADEAIAHALADDDGELAASYLELADARGLAVDPNLRARVLAANDGAAAAWRSAKHFGYGFFTGTPEDLAGFAGAAAGDLTAWGDLRDASREGWKYANGEAVDPLILGLSVAGLALTAGTYATFGAGLPVRAGVSAVKIAKRTGRLSVGMTRLLTRAVNETVDFAALRRAGTSLDATALKGAVRADGLKPLARLMGDLGTVQAKAGSRAAVAGLAVAENGKDLSRLARLAEAKGGQTLAILKTLGRGALVMGSALLKLVWWGLVAALWLFGLVASFNRFCVEMVRPIWRRKRVRGRKAQPRALCAAPMPPADPRLDVSASADATHPAPAGPSAVARFEQAAREAASLSAV
ncbi:hypothetical protein [Roseixanthobacter glucoisosaccharinicivorans]|uniref:hypothetical protein n=1 Tax=Roseixanthobacter glucoisosaccharinicivorans TaxID=3119923 RepID=UPI003726526E